MPHMDDHFITGENAVRRYEHFLAILARQTLTMFKDILLARSPTDFLWVHSSKISPIPNRNIMEPAVLKITANYRNANGSGIKTGTSNFPSINIYSFCKDSGGVFNDVTTVLPGEGTNHFLRDEVQFFVSVFLIKIIKISCLE